MNKKMKLKQAEKIKALQAARLINIWLRFLITGLQIVLYFALIILAIVCIKYGIDNWWVGS